MVKTVRYSDISYMLVITVQYYVVYFAMKWIVCKTGVPTTKTCSTHRNTTLCVLYLNEPHIQRLPYNGPKPLLCAVKFETTAVE